MRSSASEPRLRPNAHAFTRSTRPLWKPRGPNCGERSAHAFFYSCPCPCPCHPPLYLPLPLCPVLQRPAIGSCTQRPAPYHRPRPENPLPPIFLVNSPPLITTHIASLALTGIHADSPSTPPPSATHLARPPLSPPNSPPYLSPPPTSPAPAPHCHHPNQQPSLLASPPMLLRSTAV